MASLLAAKGQLEIIIAGVRYRLGAGHDLSITVRFDEDNGRAFGLAPAATEPVRGGSFVGDVRLGGSCNCETHHLCPHSAGTHTEHVGHVLAERVPLSSVSFAPLMVAALLRVSPSRLSDVSDDVAGNHHQDDRVIDALSLQEAYAVIDPGLACTAVVIASAPYAQCVSARHTGANPPYLTLDAMAWLRESGIDHLLVDLPSVDREDDGGLLGAHRVFFGVPPRGQSMMGSPPVRTITELIAVPDDAAAGVYALLLQTPSWGADAAPSRPVLYAIQRPQPRATTTVDEAIAYAFDLLDEGEGFAAHEVLEPWWLQARAADHHEQTAWLHALIKLGAAQVKRAHRNARGLRSHCEQASSLLAMVPLAPRHAEAMAHLRRLERDFVD